MTEFPHLTWDQEVDFPSLARAPRRGPVFGGGNLSPGLLLSAYRQGLFPWYEPGETIMWWCPDPRFVLFPDQLHISATLARLLRQRRFEVTLDRDFAAVINACARTPRPGQEAGTWIGPDMIEAYCALHALGFAHSVEVWREGELAGGLYGICLGQVFLGESMFARVSNASKVGFAILVPWLARQGIGLIDCQTPTRHLASLGARSIPRREFLNRIAALIQAPTLKGSWNY